MEKNNKKQTRTANKQNKNHTKTAQAETKQKQGKVNGWSVRNVSNWQEGDNLVSS